MVYRLDANQVPVVGGPWLVPLFLSLQVSLKVADDGDSLELLWNVEEPGLEPGEEEGRRRDAGIGEEEGPRGPCGEVVGASCCGDTSFLEKRPRALRGGGGP